MSDDDPSRREVLQSAATVAAMCALGLTWASWAAAAEGKVSVPDYLLLRLQELGVDALFGVPGATCDPLFHAAAPSPVRVVVTASDLGAGYAADGYARTNGLGAVAVTYGVGTMALLSVVAGAYAERCPIVVISGGPSSDDLWQQEEHDTLFSHSSGGPDIDLQLFRPVTAAAVRVERASEVPKVVDEALRTALVEQRPVYIEIAKHLWWASCEAPTQPLLASPPAGAARLVAEEVLAVLGAAERPLVMVGVELRRWGLQDQARALLDTLGVPWVSTFLGKAVLDEQGAGFAGVYAGGRSVPAVRSLVDDADALLCLGCIMGRQYRSLASGERPGLLRVGGGVARLGKAPPQAASLSAVVSALALDAVAAGSPGWSKRASLVDRSFAARRTSLLPTQPPSSLSREEGMDYDEVLSVVSESLSDSVLLVTDTSLSMYPAAEVDVQGRDGFLCNAVWNAIGYSVGAAVGAAVAQGRRPLVVCGDGGFQMTAQALSTMAQYRLPCVVVVLDNGLYGIEQWLLDPTWHKEATSEPRPYLALNRWRYADLARALGVGHAAEVGDGAALQAALAEALQRKGPTLVSVQVKQHALPSELRA